MAEEARLDRLLDRLIQSVIALQILRALQTQQAMPPEVAKTLEEAAEKVSEAIAKIADRYDIVLKQLEDIASKLKDAVYIEVRRVVYEPKPLAYITANVGEAIETIEASVVDGVVANVSEGMQTINIVAGDLYATVEEYVEGGQR